MTIDKETILLPIIKVLNLGAQMQPSDATPWLSVRLSLHSEKGGQGQHTHPILHLWVHEHHLSTSTRRVSGKTIVSGTKWVMS